MTKSVTKIQDKDSRKRLSVVQSTEDPTKYGVVILNPDGSKIRWPKGDKWDKWDTGTIEVGTTCTWEPWTNACVVNSWSCTSAVLDFTIPRWDKWETWNAATVNVGSTTTGNAGTCACVVNSGDCHNAVLDFTIPKGDKWDTGDDACVSVGTTCTWNPWTEANVENVGTPWNAVLNFTIPQWVKGDTWNAATVSVGTTSTLNPWCNACVSNSWDCHSAVLNFWIPKGEKGETGAGATVSIGTTTTLDEWCCATVSNSGSSSAAVFNFGIPKGDKGDKWDTGNGATVSIGSTTTLCAWCSATVSNSWTSSNAILNFGIPKGEKGEIWCTWATWNGIAGITCSKSWKVTTVTIEETNGCCFDFTVCDGNDWEGSWDVLWPSSATSGNIVLFDGNSGKCIKQWGAVVDVLNSSCNTDVLSAKQWCVLNSCITAINGKIPSEASCSNQLADKCFVNSSINSLAAFYITKNAQGEQFATYSELSSATTFYSGWVVRVPTQNDYTIVASDENHDNATTRYSYQWSQWEYQYTVNETPLTQGQLDALNSWITATKVCCYDEYATWKQDCLVSGTSIATINGCDLLCGGNITTPNTTYSQATCADLWLIKLGSNTAQSVSANAVTWCTGRTYALQVNSCGQGVVNVPWENTTYSNWNWLCLQGGEFCIDTSVVATKTDLAWKQDNLTAWANIDITTNKIKANNVFIVKECDTCTTYTWTKWVAPYNTCYCYTNICINPDSWIEWKEWAIYTFDIDTKMIATSACRNVRVKIGDGDYIPVMWTSCILGWSNYFTKANIRQYQYSTKYQSCGALHLFTDSNTTYSAIGTAEIDAGTCTCARTITAANLKYAIQCWDGNVVSNDAYSCSWDGISGVAPSKDAVYDKIESIVCAIPTDNCQLWNSCGYITSSSLPWNASSTVAWIVKLGSDTVQSCSTEAVSCVASRTYWVQVNGSWQMVVNVPRQNTQCVSSVNGCTWSVNLSIPTVSNDAFGSSWDNNMDAPSKNAIYDVLGDVETLLAAL